MNWLWVVLFLCLGVVTFGIPLRAIQSGFARYMLFTFRREREPASFWFTIGFWFLCSLCLIIVAAVIAVRQVTS